jgi:NDP-sugar pyrophosphorylase family protein
MTVAAESVDALPPVCVLVGGRGTRLGSLTETMPKPMVTVAGRPFIDWVLLRLAAEGFTRVVMCLGYRGDVLARHVGDGDRFGVSVAYSWDGPAPAGTMGAIRQALPLLTEPVPVLFGDTFLESGLARVVAHHRQSACPATMSVLRNSGRWDTSNALVADGMVIQYSKSPPPTAEWIDYGFSVLDRQVVASSSASDLGVVMEDLAARSRLSACCVTEPFYEIGTPAGRERTEMHLAATSALIPGPHPDRASR